MNRKLAEDRAWDVVMGGVAGWWLREGWDEHGWVGILAVLIWLGVIAFVYFVAGVVYKEIRDWLRARKGTRPGR